MKSNLPQADSPKCFLTDLIHLFRVCHKIAGKLPDHERSELLEAVADLERYPMDLGGDQ